MSPQQGETNKDSAMLNLKTTKALLPTARVFRTDRNSIKIEVGGLEIHARNCQGWTAISWDRSNAQGDLVGSGYEEFSPAQTSDLRDYLTGLL